MIQLQGLGADGPRLMDSMFELQILPIPRQVLVFTTIEYTARCLRPFLPFRNLRSVAGRIASYAASAKSFNDGADQKVKKIRKLVRQMNSAQSLEEYETCTTLLDQLQDHETWKKDIESIESEYNPRLIAMHIKLLQDATTRLDVGALQHLLRTSFSRDLGGMNSLRLYKHSWFGTKRLIDDYIDAAIKAIEMLVQAAITYKLPGEELRYFEKLLEEALVYFGRSALTLSGGATLGMKHIGVIKTLWECDLLPDIISGASAGSIVAAIVAGHTDDELEDVFSRFPQSNLACFDPPGTGYVGWLRNRVLNYLYSGKFFDMSHLANVMRSWFGDLTFLEAYNKTGRTLNICVSSSNSGEPRLLNWFTAPDVYIWSAVCASCSVPGVFSPACIYEKESITKETRIWMSNAGQMFVDGSLDHDIPMRKLSEMFNVNFFIVSQVNPHVRMFLGQEEVFRGVQPSNLAPSGSQLRVFKRAIQQQIIHFSQHIEYLGVPELWYRATSLLTQQYTGHINILPELYASEYLTMMMNPTPDFMVQATKCGERATWPKMCRIRNSVAIELVLRKAIHRIKEEVNFGHEERMAREASTKEGRTDSRRGRRSRPGFPRRRSLSGNYRVNDPIFIPADNSALPSPTLKKDLRRNSSFGSLSEQLPSFTTRSSVPLLSPQAGIEPVLSALTPSTTDSTKSEIWTTF